MEDAAFSALLERHRRGCSMRAFPRSDRELVGARTLETGAVGLHYRRRR